MDKRILSLVAAFASAGAYVLSRRFLHPMEDFIPALSGLGFILVGLIVFEMLFAHLVKAAWLFVGGVCAFGWLLILWPRYWVESWLAASFVCMTCLGAILKKSARRDDRAVARKLLIGQSLGFAAAAAVYAAERAGVLPWSLNLFSPVVLLFPLSFLWGMKEAERRRSQSYIVQSAKRDTFESLVQGLAHELNNPLNFIYANIEPLREFVEKMTLLPEGPERAGLKRDVEKILETIEEGVVRARGLVDRFRDFPSGGAEPKENVDVNRIVDQTVEMLAPKWKDRLSMERRLGELPAVSAYPLQLGQIFTNVIANACDATPDGGKVVVSTQPGATGVKVSIRDTGPGIPKERVPRIFDPFYTTKEQGQGMGLGLSITQQLVKNHKGAIEVKSEVGKGTEFLISLPYS